MEINRAKQEIINTVKAYLKQDENGRTLIPEIRQRPILLIGPPGIGKTAIMEQAARECGIGLAAYTMTHHTRQSAMGLPFIQEKQFDGRTCSVTAYTMSEIIASVYEKIEQTGLQNGILFIDEINCVSETLAPVMLQFLQAKTFGNTRVPSGWVIAAAGNPPEYNRSVRPLDVVTLDRVKRIDIEPDYAVWKEYAVRQSVHRAILSYLDARQENFYRIETTVDGKQFVTARGWEDLSDLMKVYEELGLPVDEAVIEQYLQFPEVAMDFANYLTLYYKYEKAYSAADILEGRVSEAVCERLQSAPFDERISVVSLVLGALESRFKDCIRLDKIVDGLYGELKYFQRSPQLSFEEVCRAARKFYEQKVQGGLLDAQGQDIRLKILGWLDRWNILLKEEGIHGHQEAYERLTTAFSALMAERETAVNETMKALEQAFDFMEQQFATGPELAFFVSELAAGYYSLEFIQETGCERFYRYYGGMMRENRRAQLSSEIEQMQG